MVWDHRKKQIELALEAINRPRPYRPFKVRPHDPDHDPRRTLNVGGWITSEIFLVGKSPRELEQLLGFCSQPGKEYLRHGADLFELTRPVRASEITTGGCYTYLPGGLPWDGEDMRWPPGTGAPQWKLNDGVTVACRFVATVQHDNMYLSR